MSAEPDRCAVAVAPGGDDSPLAAAVRAGGGRVVDPDEADGLVWASPWRPGDLATLLADHPQIRWVQLPFAGIESFVPLLDEERTWTCG